MKGAVVMVVAMYVGTTCFLAGCSKSPSDNAKEAFKTLVAEKYPACSPGSIDIRKASLSRTELNSEYYDASGTCAISCVAQEPAMINGIAVAPGDKLKGSIDADFMFAKGSSGRIEITRYGVNNFAITKNN